MITAQFMCTYLYKTSDNTRVDIYFDPVMKEGLPAGNLYLTISEPDDFARFEEGKTYSLKIEETESEQNG